MLVGYRHITSQARKNSITEKIVVVVYNVDTYLDRNLSSRRSRPWTFFCLKRRLTDHNSQNETYLYQLYIKCYKSSGTNDVNKNICKVLLKLSKTFEIKITHKMLLITQTHLELRVSMSWMRYKILISVASV